MTERIISNEEKRQVYALLKTKLKVAVNQEFYLEALLLEYSIIEDRLTSILEHCGIRSTNSKGDPLGIQAKLKKIENAIRSKRIPIYGKVNKELIDDIFLWKDTRNTLVHRSCQRLFNSEEVKDCAISGKEIVRRLTNTAAAVKRAAEKQ